MEAFDIIGPYVYGVGFEVIRLIDWLHSSLIDTLPKDLKRFT